MLQNLYFIIGFPRSGASSFAAAFDSFANAVCLNEPRHQLRNNFQIENPSKNTLKWLLGDMIWQRQRLLDQEPVYDLRHENGSAVFDSLRFMANPTDSLLERPHAGFTRAELTKKMALGVKHNALLAGLLPDLATLKGPRKIAIIRSPSAMIQSWLNLPNNIELAQLLAPAIPHWPELGALIKSDVPIIERYMHIAECWFKRVYEHRENIAVIRYEDFIENPQILSDMLERRDVPPNYHQLQTPTQPSLPGEQEKLQQLISEQMTYAKHFYHY